MFLLGAITISFAQPTATLTPIPIPPPVELDGEPGRTTVGLASDGEHLWASDPETKTIYRHIGGDTWEVKITWDDRQPGPLAWGDSGLWVVDISNHVIVRFDFDSDSERLSELRTIPIPRAALREVPSITGLTWDGRALWLSTGCGLCSAFFRIDPGEGEVNQAFFPGCEPRGLAFDLDFGYLWTIAYSGPYKPALLSMRKISGSPDAVPPSQKFRNFGLGATPPVDPTVIVFHDGLRVLDRKDGKFVRYDPSSVDP